MASKTKNKEIKTEAKVETKKKFDETTVQLNIFCEEDVREAFKRLCTVRGWTHGQGLKALLAFLEDTRNRPRLASNWITKHGLDKVKE